MKKLFLLFLFCLPILSNGQRWIKGKVIDADTKEPISNAEINLIGSDGNYFFVAKSDSTGYYTIDSNHFSAKINYVISARRYSGNPGYFESNRQSIVSSGNLLLDTVTKNFALEKPNAIIDPHIPVGFFIKNSPNLSKGLKDTVLDSWYKYLAAYPGVVIEINGHSDKKEKHPLELSQLRAKLCRDYLIHKGMD